MRTSGKGWGRCTHQKKTGYGYRKKKKIQQTITIVCLLLSPTFLLHENKVRDQLCNKHVHRNDCCWRLPWVTCLGQWSLFTSLSYTLRYSPTKWRTYIYIYIHHFTRRCQTYVMAQRTDVHVFTTVHADATITLQPDKQTYMYSPFHCCSHRPGRFWRRGSCRAEKG